MGHLYLIMLIWCGISYTCCQAVLDVPNSPASIMEGFFVNGLSFSNSNWTRVNSSRKEYIEMRKLWQENNAEHEYRDPALFHSKIYGYVVGERQTLQKFAYPQGRFWTDMRKLERQCLCVRRKSDIRPNLSFQALNRTTAYYRPSGNIHHLLWKWEDDFVTGADNNRGNMLTPAMTMYRVMVLKLFKHYGVVNATCISTISYHPANINADPDPIADWTNMTFEVTVKWSNNRLRAIPLWDYPVMLKMGLTWRGLYLRRNYRLSFPPKHRRYDVLTEDANTYRRINCAFQGQALVFEPLDLDLVIQEIDPSINTIGFRKWFPDNGLPLNVVQRHTQGSVLPGTDYDSVISEGRKVANATDQSLSRVLGRWFGVDWPPSTHFAALNDLPQGYLEGIKWIKPSKDDYELRDGSETKVPGKIQLLNTFPSMVRSDTKCHKRVRRFRPLCNDPVTGPRGKLAFGNDVRYDPSNNRSYWPGPPLQLWGADPPSNEDMKTKRAFGFLALVFSGLSTAVTNLHSGIEMKSLADELNAKMDKFTDEMNARFSKNEHRLQQLGERINQESAINQVQNERLNRLVLDILAGRELMSERIELLESRVDTNSQAILYQFAQFINIAENMRSLSLAELALNRIVTETLTNLTGIPYFDRTKAYDVRIRQGVLQLQEIAELARSKREMYNVSLTERVNQAVHLRKQQGNQTRNLTASLAAWQKVSNQSIQFINTSAWLQNNISFEHIERNSTTIGESLLEGLETVVNFAGDAVETGITGVTDILGTGLEKLFGPISKFLGPIAGVIFALIILYCVCKHRHAFSPNRRVHKRHRKRMITHLTKADMTPPDSPLMKHRKM